MRKISPLQEFDPGLHSPSRYGDYAITTHVVTFITLPFTPMPRFPWRSLSNEYLAWISYLPCVLYNLPHPPRRVHPHIFGSYVRTNYGTLHFAVFYSFLYYSSQSSCSKSVTYAFRAAQILAGGIPSYLSLITRKFTRQLSYCRQFPFWWHPTPTLPPWQAFGWAKRQTTAVNMVFVLLWLVRSKVDAMMSPLITCSCSVPPRTITLSYTALVGTEWLKCSGHLRKRGWSGQSCILWVPQSSIQEEKLKFRL